MTTLIVVIVISQGIGISLSNQFPYQIGILFGSIAGLLGAQFNRSVNLETTFKNQKAFTDTLNDTLAQMGFEKKSELDNFIIYAKSPLQTLFSGKVFVKIENNSAIIISRSYHINKLNQML